MYENIVYRIVSYHIVGSVQFSSCHVNELLLMHFSRLMSIDKDLLAHLLYCCYTQVTSEMRGDEPIVRHLVPFEAMFARGTVVAVQFGAECQNGYVQPVPRLLNLTPDWDLCIEHRTDAVKCFAELATEKVLDIYESIEHYQVID